MDHSGKLIVFSAPSGSGKTTIVRHLLEHEELNLAFSISATSRDPRGEEKHGVDYYFLSQEKFRDKADNGEFLEWEEVYPGTYYGTLRSEVERLWSEGKHLIFDIDVVGGLNIKSQFPDRTLAIFVQPPSIQELRNRLVGRKTESEEKIAMRVAKAEEEMSRAEEFDRILINDRLEVALQEATELVADFTASNVDR
jgi:guanylate kinase